MHGFLIVKKEKENQRNEDLQQINILTGEVLREGKGWIKISEQKMGFWGQHLNRSMKCSTNKVLPDLYCGTASFILVSRLERRTRRKSFRHDRVSIDEHDGFSLRLVSFETA